jgi:hypothetical protein
MEILRKKKEGILSKIVKFSIIIAFVFIVAKPVLADPKPCTGPNTPPGCYDSKDANNPDSKDSNGISINTGIKNPLSDEFKDIPTFIKGVLRFVLLIGIPLVALAIIYTGFLFVTAQVWRGRPVAVSAASQ